MLTHVTATRYIAPLREGGSLPGLVEADDLGIYVVKFTGAGQGVRVLVAEIVVGQLARLLGLRVPELRTIEMDAAIGRYDSDAEVQDLLSASIGVNLGIDFLPGSLGFDGVSHPVDAVEAANILWLDGFVANIDRTWKNPNLLVWHGKLWCIDHGAALYFQHRWPRDIDPSRFAEQPFAFPDHIFGAHVGGLAAADERLAPQVTAAVVEGVLSDVPDAWLETESGADAATVRERYRDYLLARIAPPRRWVRGVAG